MDEVTPPRPQHAAPGGTPTAPPSPPRPPRPPRSDAAQARRARWLARWRSPHLRWAVAIVAILFIAEYLLLPDLANARKSLYLLGKVNIGGLIAGLLLEGAALVAYTELSHTVLTPDSPRRFKLFRINMSSMAVSHVLPGGTAPGTAVAYRLLTERGVPSGTAAFGLAAQGVGSAIVLNAIFWLALFVSIPLTGYNPAYGFAALIGLILFVLFAVVVVLLTRGQRQPAVRLHQWASKVPFVNPDKVSSLVQTVADRLKMLLRTRALLFHALEWAALNWLFDAASLWVFVLAFGHVVSPVDLLVAYGLANILAVIPITPSGLGVVEGVLITTLSGFHTPKAIAILAVLSYRLVNFWLPIPLGGSAYVSLRWGPAWLAKAQERAQHAAGAQAAGAHRAGSWLVKMWRQRAGAPHGPRGALTRDADQVAPRKRALARAGTPVRARSASSVQIAAPVPPEAPVPPAPPAPPAPPEPTKAPVPAAPPVRDENGSATRAGPPHAR